MGVVQRSVFFLLAVHHNRLLQIHSYYNPIWFFSFLESVIRSQGQWRFWSISADSLEKGLQCSPGQAQPRVHWAVTLHPGILHRQSKCLPFLPTPPGDPHQAVTHSHLCSLIQWMFTEHLIIDWKKKYPAWKWSICLIWQTFWRLQAWDTAFQRTLTSFSGRNRTHVASRSWWFWIIKIFLYFLLPLAGAMLGARSGGN